MTRQSSIAALRGAVAYWPLACIALALAISYPHPQREPPPLPQAPANETAVQQPTREPAQELAQAPPQAQAPIHESVQAPTQEPAQAPTQEPLRESLQEPPKDQSRAPAETVEHTASIGVPEKAIVRPDKEYTPEPVPLSYLAYYAYSEVPPDIKPADTLLDAFWKTPEGTPVDEIERASKALGLDPVFMKAVGKIESGFDPKQRTGSYIGLFQLSHYEFAKYGSGDIIDARANAVAAAYKFTTAAILFELNTHKKPTLYDLYLIHQQGTQGAEEHVSHPDWIAWQSMCATDEGRQKGEKWCKRAIWQNTLPDVKKIWKSVENMTSAAFTAMWQDRVDQFYSRYSQALTAQ